MGWREELPLDALKPFENIIVTGPQRGGTRFTSKLLAHELGGRYHDERRYGGDDWIKFCWWLQRPLDIAKIFQAPGFMNKVRELDGLGCAIVMMIRPVEDIITSEKRISLRMNLRQRELDKYTPGVAATFGSVAEAKYAFWEQVKPTLKNAFEVRYNELADHPMFVPRDERKGWKFNQTSPRWKEPVDGTS